MKNLVRVLTAAAFMVSVAGRASADPIVYNNGGPNGIDGFAMGDFNEADDFTLSGTTIITDVHFWNLQGTVDDYSGSIAWAIYNNASGAPGSVVASGVASPTHTSTGGSVSGLGEYTNDFNIAPLTLGLGHYWISLHDGPLTNNTFRDFYWETANPNGTLSSMAYDLVGTPGWFPNSSELAFNLTGQAIPEPTSLALLATGAGLLAWRRKRQA